MKLEDVVIEMLDDEGEYLTDESYYDSEHQFWHYFNSCNAEQEVQLLQAIKDIKNAVKVMQKIQDDIWST